MVIRCVEKYRSEHIFLTILSIFFEMKLSEEISRRLVGCRAEKRWKPSRGSEVYSHEKNISSPTHSVDVGAVETKTSPELLFCFT